MEHKEFLKHFDLNGARGKSDGSINVRCPCHDDKKASLTISKGEKHETVLKCHAGCNYIDILAAVGLTENDLYNDDKEQEQNWRKEAKKSANGRKIEAIYDYEDVKGEYLYSKIRFEGKEIKYGVIDIKNDTYRAKKPEGVKPTMYNLPNALKAIKKGFPVYITEGEKDVDTLKKLHLTAVTAGGVSDWKKEFAHYFTGARVVILPDNDTPGLDLAKKIMHDLRPFAYSIKTVATSKADKGDVTDYLNEEGHSKEDLQKLIDEVPSIVAPWIQITEKKGGGQNLRVNPGLLKSCISEHLSYKTVDGCYYWYENGYYKRTDKNAVKAKIADYTPDIISGDNLLNNVYNLMLADDSHMANEEDFNTNEKYINFKNGLYNIDTKVLERHNSDILYTRQVNTEYNKDTVLKEYHTFYKYVRDLCTNAAGEIDWQVYKALQEIAGLAISNVYGYRTKKAAFLYSPVGNTGKSQFLGLIGHLIGQENITNIPLQNMNEDKGRFALANIGHVRLIANGDQSKADVKDSSIFKSLTGGDFVKTEAKGKDITSRVFKGFIIIACNDLPYIADDKGEHIYRRMYIIPCTHTIEEKERDPDILDKMIKELPAIVNWAIEGLHRLKANNYNFTEIAAGNQYIEDYRNNSDTVFGFLSDEGYTITKDPKDKISKKRLLEQYNQYCIREERQSVSKRQFGERLEKITGFKTVRTRIANIRDYYIQGIKEYNDGFVPVDNKQIAIFK